MPWIAEVPAVLLTWFGGQEYGNALADVLLGRRRAGRAAADDVAGERGRAAVGCPGGRDARLRGGPVVGHRNAALLSASLFPFGHGTGYTRWEYESFEPPAGAGEAATVVVRNAGTRPGREVVQVYAVVAGERGRAAGALARRASRGCRRRRASRWRSRSRCRCAGCSTGTWLRTRGRWRRARSRSPRVGRAPISASRAALPRRLSRRAGFPLTRARPGACCAPAPIPVAPPADPARPTPPTPSARAPRVLRRHLGTLSSPTRLEPRASPLQAATHAPTPAPRGTSRGRARRDPAARRAPARGRVAARRGGPRRMGGRRRRARGRPRGGDRRRRRAAAARARARAGLRRGLRVKEPERGTVTVTVRIPPVLGLRVLGHTSATARFRPQE